MKRKNLVTILKKASIISKAIEAEAEEILEDAELAVRDSVPKCNVASVLRDVEKALAKEGVEALFDKRVPKAASLASGEKLTDEEKKALVEKITKAVVDEFEDVLKDADEVCEDELKAFEDEDDFEIEGKLKSVLEKKLAEKGIYANLERKAKKASVKKDISASFSNRRNRRK